MSGFNKTWFKESVAEFKRLPAFLSGIKILDDDLTYYAASLSFYTLFAIIPLLWILFSVYSQMPSFAAYYDVFKDTLMGVIAPGHSDIVIRYLDEFLNNSSRMGWVGLLYIVFTSVLFLTNYGYVVNKIFHVPNRHFFHSIVNFIAISVLAPFVLGTIFYMSSLLPQLIGDMPPRLNWVYGLYSYLLIWMFFFVVFKISANTHVDVVPALVSSLLVSLLWHLTKTAFLFYVFVNRTYTTLYGSFSLLLLTLLWIYLSWVLCLYGLKLCYYLQYTKNTRPT